MSKSSKISHDDIPVGTNPGSLVFGPHSVIGGKQMERESTARWVPPSSAIAFAWIAFGWGQTRVDLKRRFARSFVG